MLKRWSLPLALLTALALPVLAMASEGHPSIPGAELSAVWVIPFVCMLLSIAIMPLAHRISGIITSARSPSSGALPS